MPHAMKIKKGDLVQILSGKDRGKQGRVLEARPKDRKVLVENLNIVKRHTRPRPVRNTSRVSGPQVEPGGVISKPAALPVDNVMIVCPTCKRPSRVGTHVRESKDGAVRVRVCKREGCRQEIDR